MSEDLIYQDKSEYQGKIGTLVLTRSDVKFLFISTTGARNILLQSRIQDLDAKVEGFFPKKLVLFTKSPAQTHLLKISNPEIWVKKINTTKQEE